MNQLQRNIIKKGIIMSNVQLSLNSLVKKNNGFFKSQKQADFLLSILNDNNVFASVAYGYTILTTYHFDGKGITLKTKTSVKTNKTTEEWSRKIEGVLSVEEQQIIKRLNKQLKSVKKEYASRLKSYNDGSYFGNNAPSNTDLEIYNNSQNDRLDLISRIEKTLKQYN